MDLLFIVISKVFFCIGLFISLVVLFSLGKWAMRRNSIYGIRWISWL